MAFTIPDRDESLSPRPQSVWMQTDIDAIIAGVRDTAVLSGCTVTAQGTPDMTVAVASGDVVSGGSEAAVSAGNAVIAAASALPRVDCVVATSAGAVAVRQGTPATACKMPALTAGDVLLAAVYVPAGLAAVTSSHITDKRVMAHDHGSSHGLDDDDHAQYLLLAGRGAQQSVVGGLGVTTYSRIGSADAPANTSAGDLTAGRLMLGTDRVFDGGTDNYGITGITDALIHGYRVMTAESGTRPFVSFNADFAPAANSTAIFRTLNFIGRINGLGSMNFITCAQFDLRMGANQSSGVTNVVGVYFPGLHFGTAPSSGSAISLLRGMLSEAVIATSGKTRTISTAIAVDTVVVSVNSTGSDLTITTAIGVRVRNSNPGATIGTQIQLDLEAPTRGTTNIGIRNAGTTVNTPSTAQTLVAGTAILANAGVVQITAASPVTSTAAPTIANGQDGQEVTIVNVGANDITLSDGGTLAGSNLRLSAATIALGQGDSLRLVYSSTLGDWIQTGHTALV